MTVHRTGMAGVPGTASKIFETVKGVGASVVMISQVCISEVSSCEGCGRVVHQLNGCPLYARIDSNGSVFILVLLVQLSLSTTAVT